MFSMQREHLKSLMLFYMECVGAKGPFLADGVYSFISNHDLFVSEILASMDDVEVKDVVKSVATLFINAINGINKIVVDRDSNTRCATSKDFKYHPL
ncbi:hypothetical protein KXD40_007830 [Peronospora effusa]|nr:hypothetical protein KXD40_007830 [Peronospora effusa]